MMATRSQRDLSQSNYWSRLHEHLQQTEAVPSPQARAVICCEPNWKWRLNLHDFDLWMPLSGSGMFSLCGQMCEIKRGTLFVLRPGDEGMATHHPSDRLTVAMCHFSWCQRGTEKRVEVADDLLPARYTSLIDPSYCEDRMTRLARLVQQPDPLASIEERYLLGELMIEAYRATARQEGKLKPDLDPRIAEAMAYIRAHPSKRVTLDEVSALVGLSPAYFSRLFSTQVGVPFRQFRVRARLERARELLAEHTLTISEIAYALGYTDVFLFSKQFREFFGMPPSKFRDAIADSSLEA